MENPIKQQLTNPLDNVSQKIVQRNLIVVRSIDTDEETMDVTVNSKPYTIDYGTPEGTSPAGSNTEVQFNDDGSFGADPGLTYVSGTETLTVGDGDDGVLVTQKIKGHASQGELAIEGVDGGGSESESVYIRAGNGVASDEDGGHVSIQAGIPEGSGDPGRVSILGGSIPSGSGSDLGPAGSIVIGDDYIYVMAEGVWKRVALLTW